MARYTKKEKVCNLCFGCMNDCKQQQPIEYCENFVQSYSRHEYMKMIKEENVDLKKLCNKYRISYNYMMKMLNGEIHFKFKYRKILESRLGEVEEFIPYVEKFDKMAVQNG